MKMFNWEEHEIANILWGEDREADDHVVPFPEDTEKKDRPDCIAKKTLLDIGPEALGDQNDEKELGDLVGNSWAKIGSFDDLDHIFSNDELEGHTSLASTDELWSSSRDLVSGTAKSSPTAVGSRTWDFEALGNTPSHTELNSEYALHDNPSATTSNEKFGSASSYSRQRTARYVEQEQYSLSTPVLIEEKTALGVSGKLAIDSHVAPENVASPNKSTEKGIWSKSQLKHKPTTSNCTGSRLLGDACDSWPSSAANISQYDRICALSTVQNFRAPHPNQQWLPNESRATTYQPFMNPHAQCGYEKLPQQYPAMQMLKPNNDKLQSRLYDSATYQGDIVSLNRPVQKMGRTMKMTPQEKIEKLRRRQQMRALLAIQKQQQQLHHQSSAVDSPLAQKSCQDDQIVLIEKTDLEYDMTVSYNDPGSPSKRDDLSTISAMEEHSVEDTVLYQLQDIIDRLDTKTRLCMKDSLYRLAHSATERHHGSDTNAINRTSACNPDVAKEEISNQQGVGEDANIENETNQIDRVVAHLLFHRPLKSSVRHADTPGSSPSNRFCIGQETGASSLPTGVLVKSSDRDSNSSPCGSKNPQTFADSCLENISNEDEHGRAG